MKKQNMQNIDSANENHVHLQRTSWFLLVWLECQTSQPKMSSTCFSSFLECSYSGSPNDWPLFTLNLNVILSKWSYLTFCSKLLLPFRASASPHGIFAITGQKQSFLKSLLTLSESDGHKPTYLNKTLYCHLPKNFCNKYTNLQCDMNSAS